MSNFPVFTRFERALLDALGISAATVVILSCIYFFYQLNAWITIPISIAAIGWWMMRIRRLKSSVTPASSRVKSDETEGSLSLSKSDSSTKGFLRASQSLLGRNDEKSIAALINIALNFVLLGMFLAARTSSAIVSPWQVLPALAFGLYFVSTAALIVALSHSPTDAPRSTHPRFTFLATILHFAVTWGVALFIYRFGFGYDPFVHQATERYILAHGFILPKQPFYLGQYSIVVALNQLFRIPSDLIDQYLVPLFAIIILPIIYFITAKFRSNNAPRFIGVISFLLIPFSVLTFTIPHNLSFVFLVIIILLLPIADGARLNWHLIALAIAAFACHPLLGIPSVLIVGSHLLSRRWKTAWILPFLGCVIFLPVSFGIYNHLHQGMPVFIPLLMDVQEAFSTLFNSPYNITTNNMLSMLYRFMHLWPLLFCVIGVVGYWKQDRIRSTSARILVSTSMGLVLAALWLASGIRFADILPTEQFEFALRLIVITPIFFLPGVAFLLERAMTTNIRFITMTCVLSAIATASWYMTYPQYNEIAHLTAPGISGAEINAVDSIEKQANGESYAVLSHQMMSAAALRRFGFERTIETNVGKRYPYAIPTGGELYAEYLELWKTNNALAWKRSAFDEIHTKQIYVVIPVNWDPNNQLDQLFRTLTPTSTTIDSAIRVYQLLR